MKIVKKSDMVGREIDENYTVHNIITRDVSEKVSLAIGVAKDVRIRTKNLRSDRIYHILEGELSIYCDGKERVLGLGDSAFIEANKPYLFSGTFKAIIINSPAFSTENEIHLEEE